MGKSLAAHAAALIQAPANLLAESRRGGRPIRKLAMVTAFCIVATGIIVASFSGGAQFFIVPIKLTLGLFACALLCLPSLYVFSSIAGGGQSLKETALALMMGVALIGVLQVALAPVAWLFSQTTATAEVMGTLYVVSLVSTALLGVGLIVRTLRALNGSKIRGMRMWGLLFVFVMLQMSTTLRPLVGPYEGELIGNKMFFLEHWTEPSSNEGRDKYYGDQTREAR